MKFSTALSNLYVSNVNYVTQRISKLGLSVLALSSLLASNSYAGESFGASQLIQSKRIAAVPVSITGRVVSPKNSFNSDQFSSYSTDEGQRQLSQCESQPTLNNASSTDAHGTVGSCVSYEGNVTIVWL